MSRFDPIDAHGNDRAAFAFHHQRTKRPAGAFADIVTGQADRHRHPLLGRRQYIRQTGGKAARPARQINPDTGQGFHDARRCLTASNRLIPAATDTLRLSIAPGIGMRAS